MEFGVYLTGAFGQSGELYKARNEAKRGRGSHQAVEAQIFQDTKTVIDRQIKAGTHFVIDPMFNSYYLFQSLVEKPRIEGEDYIIEHVSGIFNHLFRHLTGRVPRIRVGPQENWFGNNVFYWRPQINGPLRRTKGFTSDYVHLDLLPQDGTAMVVLPSPYTLLMLSDVDGYEDRKAAITDISQLIREEAKSLVAKGVGRIQYDEPVIAVKQSLGKIIPEDLSLLEIAIAQCGRIDGASTSLHTYFGDVTPLLDFLRQLPVDCIGIDATETNMDNINLKFPGRELAIGLVNARSASIESVEDLAEKLRRIAEATEPRALWLTPNTATEYIGWTLAMEKLKVLEEANRIFE